MGSGSNRTHGIVFAILQLLSRAARLGIVVFFDLDVLVHRCHKLAHGGTRGVVGRRGAGSGHLDLRLVSCDILRRVLRVRTYGLVDGEDAYGRGLTQVRGGVVDE